MRDRSTLLVLLLCSACSARVEAALPVAQTVETGRDCAHAALACDLDRCTAEIDNRCDTPVTCRLGIESQCEAGGEVGPVNAMTKPITQLAGTKKVIEAVTSCHQGAPITTKVQSLTCI